MKKFLVIALIGIISVVGAASLAVLDNEYSVDSTLDFHNSGTPEYEELDFHNSGTPEYEELDFHNSGTPEYEER